MPKKPARMTAEVSEDDPDHIADLMIAEVSKQIKARLKELHMNMSDLARIIHVTPQHVSQELRGVRRMSLPTIIRIARVLNMQIEFKLVVVGGGDDAIYSQSR